MPRANQEFLSYAFPLWGFCQWCLKRLNRDEATADHICPTSLGGTNDWSNLLVSCYNCNHRRGNRRVISRKRCWRNDRIAKPHGPLWCGPRRNTEALRPKSYWCDCHGLIMKISATTKINVFDLFVHDRADYGPFAPESVAAGINARLSEQLDEATAVVLPPSESGLDRMILSWEPYGDEPVVFNSRYYDVDEVKKTLPSEVVAVLEKLNADGMQLE